MTGSKGVRGSRYQPGDVVEHGPTGAKHRLLVVGSTEHHAYVVSFESLTSMTLPHGSISPSADRSIVFGRVEHRDHALAELRRHGAADILPSHEMAVLRNSIRDARILDLRTPKEVAREILGGAADDVDPAGQPGGRS